MSELMFIGLYLIFRNGSVPKRIDLYLLSVGSLPVMILAIAGRLDLVIMDPDTASTTFLSTIGNVNWICGYLAVMFPVGYGLYLTGRNALETGSLGICLLVFYLSFLTNGSNSSYLILAVVFLAGLVMSLSDAEIRKRWALSLLLFAISCFLLYLLRIYDRALFRHALYDWENLAKHLAKPSFISVLAGSSLIILFLPVKCILKKQPVRYLPYATCAALVLILAEQLTGVIPLADEAGNMRGAIWRICRAFYDGLSFREKMFGVGPDCFAAYTTGEWRIMKLVLEVYPSSRLTNGHSEPLTTLLNMGWTGAAAYVSVMICGMKTAVHSYLSDKDTAMGICAFLMITAVSAHLSVSFRTVIMMPYVWVLLGMLRK